MLNRKDSKGVTLVEVMIALVILLLVFMGLIQASIVSINANMRNETRDEAARLTSDIMTQLRAAPFDDLDRSPITAAPASPDPANFTVAAALTTRSIRNATIPYTVNVIIQALDANHKQITITTQWTWQGELMTHRIDTYRGI